MDKLFKIDAAIIIIILTAVSYGLAYAYQYSYMRFYHLPSTFLEMNLTNMVRPLLLNFCLIAILWNIIYVIILLRTSLKTSEKASEKVPEFKKTNVYIIILSILGVVLLGGGLFGQFKASTEKNYMVIKQNENLFVGVTSYKDSIIIAPLDLEKETITPKFKAVEIKELKDAEMIHFENGLKVEDMKNSKDFKKSRDLKNMDIPNPVNDHNKSIQPFKTHDNLADSF